MHLVMHPDMVYTYPIWQVGLMLAGVSVLGAVVVELAARRFIPIELRRNTNDVSAAMFSIIGVTYAVLLAFVAMLAWEGFNKARAASYDEAALVLDVYYASIGFADPTAAAMRNDIAGYARTVAETEWPAQAQGQRVDSGMAYLDRLNRTAASLHPATQADGNRHAMLLQSLARLSDARQQRLLAGESTIPAIVWVTLILGGGLTIAFGSFLGAASLRMHLAMSSALAVSGALVLILIVALSNPFRGDFRVSTAPFDYVLTQIKEPPATAPLVSKGADFEK